MGDRPHAPLASMEVVGPGLLTTIQDGGRRYLTHLGVPPSGACDPHGLAVANLLLGNDRDAAALEVTIVGPVLRVLQPAVIAIGGAELGARVREEARTLAAGASHLVRAGAHIEFAPDGSDGYGIRAYLAVPGGIDVPEVLGSRSTCLAGGFGGVDGRPLRIGDRIAARGPHDPTVAGRRWPEPDRGTVGADGVHVIRAVAHEAHAAPLDARSWLDLTRETWEVSAHSDRTGLRLLGPTLRPSGGHTLEIVSQAMVWGAVQVPPSGEPIALLADHQTVGGYPVPLVAITADRPVLGQLGAGDRLRFEIVDLDTAHALARAAEARLTATAAAVGRTEPPEIT